MESVGRKLREARLRLGMALEDVSAATRIKINHLEAIESDNICHFDSRFFYRSFVRQFAQFLQLDYDQLRTGVESAAADLPEALVPGQPGTPSRPEIAGLKPKPVRKVRWLFSFGSLALMLVICSSVYASWESARYNWQASLLSYVDSVPGRLKTVFQSAPQQHETQSKPVTSQATPDAVDQKQAEPSPKPAQDLDALTIRLSAIEKTWLSIVADGKEVYSGILEADETKTLESHDSARLRTGNAGGVDVVFNGREIGPLGPRGQVRTVVFTRDGYEILQPQPHIALTSYTISAE